MAAREAKLGLSYIGPDVPQPIPVIILEARKWQGVTVPCGSPRRTLKKKMGVAKLGYIGSVFRWLLVYLGEGLVPMETVP